MGELLGAVGLAWPRLLLYPGGLFALAAAWLLGRWLGIAGLGTGSQGWGFLAVVPPLVAVSLLPLAPARAFPYGLDLVIALALLEAPRLGALARAGREELARDYLPLLVAAAAMAGAAGGLELTRLLRVPEAWPGRALLGVGAALWLVALPRLVAGGPAGLAGRLRSLGLLAVAALPVLGALAAAELLPVELAGWALPPLALAVVALALGAVTRLPERPRTGLATSLGVAALALLALKGLGP
jgi:hypothetical protein